MLFFLYFVTSFCAVYKETQINMIIDSIKHISHQISSVREVLPGREYFIPMTEEKLNAEREEKIRKENEEREGIRCI